jgi:hypothetical protein
MKRGACTGETTYFVETASFSSLLFPPIIRCMEISDGHPDIQQRKKGAFMTWSLEFSTTLQGGVSLCSTQVGPPRLYFLQIEHVHETANCFEI